MNRLQTSCGRAGALVVLVSFLAGTAPSGVAVPFDFAVRALPTEVCPAAPQPRPPIVILGDDGFEVPGSGVRFGSGTAADPYVICGWDIAPQGPDGILLKDTTARVVVRNNYVHDSFVELKFYDTSGTIPLDKRIRAGVYLYNADNVVVEDNRIERMGWIVSVHPCDCILLPGADGVAVEFSANVLVRGNVLADNSATGARLRESTNVAFHGNTVIENGHYGLVVWGIPGVSVVGNEVTQSHAASAVNIANAPAAIVSGNTVTASEVNVALAIQSAGAIVEDNSASGALWGIYLAGSDGAFLAGNTATDNERIGIYVAGSDAITMEGSTVTGSEIGVEVYASGATISGSTLSANGVGIRSVGTGNSIHGSNVAGNAVGARNFGPGSLDARENWWGCVGGPGAAGCDTVDGDVLFDPWLLAPA